MFAGFRFFDVVLFVGALVRLILNVVKMNVMISVL